MFFWNSDRERLNRQLGDLALAVGKLSIKLDVLTHLGVRSMATQKEVADQLKDVTAKLSKIGTETGTLLTKIEELKAVIEAGGNVTPELQAAVDALAAQAQVVDDLVPDATP